MRPTTTSPEFSPMRAGTPKPTRVCCDCEKRSSSRASSSAAWQARTPWSSCATGAPKSAITPSPVNWLIVPSKRCTPSARIRNQVSRSWCQASSPSRFESSVEPAMSANSTVTCLRSPSSAEREVRIRSARCRGVYARGGRPAAAPSGAPQWSQKRASARLLRPHDAQFMRLR